MTVAALDVPAGTGPRISSHRPNGWRFGVFEGRGGWRSLEGTRGVLQALQAPVGNGDPVAQPRGAELLAVEEAVEDARARDLARVLEQQPDLLEEALLASGVEPEDDVVLGKEARDDVDRLGSRSPTPAGCS